MAKKKIIKSVQDIADELLNVRLDKAELNTKDRLLSKALKEHPDFKQQSLFTIENAVSVVITDKTVAMEWAQKEAPQIITIDTAAARKLFASQMNIPFGFDTKLTARLVQAGAKPDAGYDIG